ncbi:HNH endonuclease signature motif containing protein [Nocardioides coralli]|uniref:HNH endonuclease signature motif containing protein n=1 Tax=Nocardioides coralli TaxID=2872154 RepID=UPI001CA3ECD9|nr:HNH endonuclease signature motif containing protein [Nocardioides coralli]QZY30338.1 HNH endonuclease [Nocardioides coralli]
MRHHHPDDPHGHDAASTDWRAPGCDADASPVVTEVLDRLDTALADLGELALAGLAPADVTRLLDATTRAAGRLTAATCRVAREADRRRIADDTGARNTPVWWAHRTRITRAEAARTHTLAQRLESDRHTPTATALAAGRLHADQAGVIVAAVDALPDTVTDDLRARARDHLLTAAADFDARALRILGRRILDVIAPDLAESEEQRRLEAEEAKATAKARITFHDDGHGTCHGRFTLPTHLGALFKEQLHALANPRRHHPLGTPDTDGVQDGMPGPVITPELLGRALMAYVEHYPTDRLPGHGGGGFELVVTLDHDTLLTGLGAATLPDGGRISAGEARRLACQAGITPLVLGGDSQPLDLGRTRRLFTPAQRRALAVRDRGCTTEGCGLPASVCDAHHDHPWSVGGPTDLTNARLLCPRHHRLAHDRRYTTRTNPSGRISFHRRT